MGTAFAKHKPGVNAVSHTNTKQMEENAEKFISTQPDEKKDIFWVEIQEILRGKFHVFTAKQSYS